MPSQYYNAHVEEVNALIEKYEKSGKPSLVYRAQRMKAFLQREKDKK